MHKTMAEALRGSCFALPHRQYPPTQPPQSACDRFIALDVSAELGAPLIAVSRWRGAVRAPIVSVPEAAMNKNDSPILGKYYVRCARKIFRMKSEAVAGSV